MKYKYSIKDHFKFPEKYQMTPFENLKFLETYKKTREENLKILKKNLIENFNDILNKISFHQEQDFYNKIGKNNIETERFFKFLYVDLINNKKRNDEFLEILIKKFEIKKRIFESYDYEFKENTIKFEKIKNYILLSLICLLKYEKTRNLKFLNTSLKLNDIISSKINELKDNEDLLLYSFIIKKELEKISSLCKEKGVSFE